MQTQTQNCKKLKYGRKEDPTIIYGLIVEENKDFLIFKTGKKEYRINQDLILSIEDTDTPFKDNNGGGDNVE